MKTGFIAFGMAVDVYVIREYEKIKNVYNYRDLISIQIKNNKLNYVQIDENPRLQTMHEDWWKGIDELGDMDDILKQAFRYVLNEKYIFTGKIE